MKQRTIVTSSGAVLVVREMVPEDVDAVVAGVLALSPQSARRRFFNDGVVKLGWARLADLLGTSDDQHVLLAFDLDGHLVAEVRAIRVPGAPDTAEVAIAVADRWQGQRIGSQLLGLLGDDAASLGIDRLIGHVLVDNGPGRALIEGAGSHWWIDEPGVLGFEIPMRVTTAGIDDAIGRALQTAS